MFCWWWKQEMKLSLCLIKPHAMKMYRGVEMYLHTFWTLALDRGEWSASHPDNFSPREIAPSILRTGDRVGPRFAMNIVGNRKVSCTCLESNSGSLVVSLWRTHDADWTAQAPFMLMVNETYCSFVNSIWICFIAQATTGKQGVLGPTKIYLAVQPPPTPVQQPAASVPSPVSTVTATSPATTVPAPVTAQSPIKSQPKVVVQQVAQPDTPQVCYAAWTSSARSLPCPCWVALSSMNLLHSKQKWNRMCENRSTGRVCFYSFVLQHVTHFLCICVTS
jgi:hypothetical protein